MVIYDINNDLKKILVGISIFIKSLRYSNFFKDSFKHYCGFGFFKHKYDDERIHICCNFPIECL